MQQQRQIPWWLLQQVPGATEVEADTDLEGNLQAERGPLSPQGWENWRKIPTGATLDTPAPLRFGGDLHLFVRGTDKSICGTGETPIERPPRRAASPYRNPSKMA